MIRILSLLTFLSCVSAFPNGSGNSKHMVNVKLPKAESKGDQTLILNYNAISCTCAQWSESKHNNRPDKREYFYLERSNSNLINADTLFDGKNFPVQIQVKGKVIAESGYPKDYNLAKGKGDPAKVFRYTEIKVLQNGQKKTNP